MTFITNPDIGLDEYKIHVKVVDQQQLELYLDVYHQIPLGPDPVFDVPRNAGCIFKVFLDTSQWEFADPPLNWTNGQPTHIHEHKMSPDRRSFSILDLNSQRDPTNLGEDNTSFTLQVVGSTPQLAGIVLKIDPTIVDKGEEGGNGWVE